MSGQENEWIRYLEWLAIVILLPIHSFTNSLPRETYLRATPRGTARVLHTTRCSGGPPELRVPILGLPRIQIVVMEIGEEAV